jgi:hypothetical protein
MPDVRSDVILSVRVGDMAAQEAYSGTFAYCGGNHLYKRGAHHEAAYLIHFSSSRNFVPRRGSDSWLDLCTGAGWTFAGGAAAGFSGFSGEPAKSAAPARDPDFYPWAVET